MRGEFPDNKANRLSAEKQRTIPCRHFPISRQQSLANLAKMASHMAIKKPEKSLRKLPTWPRFGHLDPVDAFGIHGPACSCDPGQAQLLLRRSPTTREGASCSRSDARGSAGRS